MSYTKQQRGNVLMSVKNISSAILGVGVDDTTIDLFESQYPVPTGVSYNSYIIRDEKTAILDTVDARATDEWMANVTEALAGEKPAYLVVHHMEPDHGANVARLAALYPEMQVVGNAKTFQYMEQFFGPEAIAKERRVVVKDGESLSLGAHTLTFVFAPMVHWPEVMVSYESTEKVLFSADGFGRFGVAHAVAFPERIGERRPDEGAEFPQVGFVDAEMAQGVLHRAGDSLHGVGQRSVEVEKEVFPVHILYKKPGLAGPGRDYGFIRRNE